MTKEQQGPTSLSKRDSSLYIKRRGCEAFLVSVYDFVAIPIAYCLWLSQFQACLSPWAICPAYVISSSESCKFPTVRPADSCK